MNCIFLKLEFQPYSLKLDVFVGIWLRLKRRSVYIWSDTYSTWLVSQSQKLDKSRSHNIQKKDLKNVQRDTVSHSLDRPLVIWRNFLQWMKLIHGLRLDSSQVLVSQSQKVVKSQTHRYNKLFYSKGHSWRVSHSWDRPFVTWRTFVNEIHAWNTITWWYISLDATHIFFNQLKSSLLSSLN